MAEKLRVILESPFAGDTEIELKRNEIYSEFCLRDCLVNHDEAPFASHLIYTRKYVLRDFIPEERTLGIEAGFAWREVAELTVFYQDFGMSSGMKLGKNDCDERDLPYEIRVLPPQLYEEFNIKFGLEKLEILNAEEE